MTIAFTRQPASSLVNCEVTHVPFQKVDLQLAFQQHERYCQSLKHMGIEVELLPSEDSFSDSVFIEDNAIILDEVAVLTSMGTISRQGEPSLLHAPLSKYRRLAEISPPAKIEGGDVFRVGKVLYVGMSSRTNGTGIHDLRAIVKSSGFQVIPIGTHQCLHLKTACTPLDDETLLINPDWLSLDPFKKFRLVRVPLEEPFGANVLRLPQGILGNAEYPLTLDLIERHGYSVTRVNLSEFSKAEAGVTCLSLIFEK